MTKEAILVTGGRDYHDHERVRKVIDSYPKGSLVIQGAAGGADDLAGHHAKSAGYGCIDVPYFKHLGRAGGQVRNQVMLDILLGLRTMGYNIHAEAFHADLSKSRGTKDMVNRCRKVGLEVNVHG